MAIVLSYKFSRLGTFLMKKKVKTLMTQTPRTQGPNRNADKSFVSI